MEIHFKPSAESARATDAYARDAVRIAAELGITLDFSEPSVEKVEQILTTMVQQMTVARPTEDEMWKFAKVFGSYVGEVMRRVCGGTWGIVILDGMDATAVELSTVPRQVVWPWYKVMARFREGPKTMFGPTS